MLIPHFEAMLGLKILHLCLKTTIPHSLLRHLWGIGFSGTRGEFCNPAWLRHAGLPQFRIGACFYAKKLKTSENHV